MITRKLNWVSAVRKSDAAAIISLDLKLSAFYTGNKNYYSDIDFTANNWINPEEEGYKQILSYIFKSKRICEFGCGSANVLKHFPQLQEKYSGCDFSTELINQNRQTFPAASFEEIRVPNLLPYVNEMFDLVFSVFVIEHSSNPAKLLDECNRILQPGGRLLILCPDFLGKGRMSSQRAGWTEGNTKDKLKKRKYLDAILTFFDNRIRIPLYCFILRLRAQKHPRFLINVTPTLFEDKFYPDVDAVYVTFKREIIKYLGKNFVLENNSIDLDKYTKDKRLIFLSFIKRKKMYDSDIK